MCLKPSELLFQDDEVLSKDALVFLKFLDGVFFIFILTYHFYKFGLALLILVFPPLKRNRLYNRFGVRNDLQIDIRATHGMGGKPFGNDSITLLDIGGLIFAVIGHLDIVDVVA